MFLISASSRSRVTGTWYPDTQAWEVAGVVTLIAGKNVVRFERKEPFPHIDKFALVPLPSTFKTPEQLAGERGLQPLFLHQWVAHLTHAGKKLAAEELKRLANDPQGPFAISVTIDAHVPDETVYKFVKALADNTDRMRSIHPSLAQFAIDKVVRNPTQLPYHPGAERFYREAGTLK